MEASLCKTGAKTMNQQPLALLQPPTWMVYIIVYYGFPPYAPLICLSAA